MTLAASAMRRGSIGRLAVPFGGRTTPSMIGRSNSAYRDRTRRSASRCDRPGRARPHPATPSDGARRRRLRSCPATRGAGRRRATHGDASRRSRKRPRSAVRMLAPFRPSTSACTSPAEAARCRAPRSAHLQRRSAHDQIQRHVTRQPRPASTGTAIRTTRQEIREAAAALLLAGFTLARRKFLSAGALTPICEQPPPERRDAIADGADRAGAQRDHEVSRTAQRPRRLRAVRRSP